jgi:hypothetical protein
MLLRMRKEFVSENSKRKQEKNDRESKERKDNQDYRINYFPFTHGESIENRRV